MAIVKGTVRSAVIMRMRAAVKTGKSASAFIRDMRESGLSYRRTTMLADWRSVGNIDKKEGLLRYVRKDYQPSPALLAEVSWKMSREFMYKVKVTTRLAPGKPLEERFVNIVNDRPMTPREIETEILEQWGRWYPERREEIESVAVETGLRRVE